MIPAAGACRETRESPSESLTGEFPVMMNAGFELRAWNWPSESKVRPPTQTARPTRVCRSPSLTPLRVTAHGRLATGRAAATSRTFAWREQTILCFRCKSPSCAVMEKAAETVSAEHSMRNFCECPFVKAVWPVTRRAMRNGSSGGPARIGEPPDLSRRHDVVIMIFVPTRDPWL